MSRSVLLVEPDIDALGTLASKLRSRGLSVSLADDVESAIDRARNSRPEALLLSDAIVQSSDILVRLANEKDLAGLPRFILVEAASGSSDQLPRGDIDAIAKRLYALPSKTDAVVVERGDFRGDLKQVSVVDLLQLLSMNRRTGALSITTALGAGEVRLADGEVVDAVYRRLEGEKALYRLLGENEGGFAFAGGSPSPMRRIQTATNLLLMEGMRQHDELRRHREAVATGDDALLAIASPRAEAGDVYQRIAEILTAPRTLDELLDDLPFADLDVLEALGKMLHDGTVRRIAKGAVRVEVADSERMTVLAAQVKRLRRSGFLGPARIVFAASPRRLATVVHAVGRIADAVVPAESVPAAPVPHLLATLRLAEGVELDVFGMPALDSYSPLWGLTLPGSAAVVRMDAGESRSLEEACSVSGIPILDAGVLLGDVDEADPAQMALLIRTALDAVAGR
jgi:hypothetical protein